MIFVVYNKILNKSSNCVVEIRIVLYYECTLFSANMKVIQMLTAQWTSTCKINFEIEIPEFVLKKLGPNKIECTTGRCITS